MMIRAVAISLAASLQNRCASAWSSLPQASHLAIAKLVTDQVRSFALSVPATCPAMPIGRTLALA